MPNPNPELVVLHCTAKIKMSSTLFDKAFWDALIDAGPLAVTPEKIRHQLQEGYDVVHLTCHGYFDSRNPLRECMKSQVATSLSIRRTLAM